MNKGDERIIYFKEWPLFSSIIKVLAITAPVASLFLFVHTFFTIKPLVLFYHSIFINIFVNIFIFIIYFIVLVIKVLLCLGVLALLSGIIKVIHYYKRRKIALLMSQNGIWVESFNFIPWENVAEINTNIEFGPLAKKVDVMGIRVKDLGGLFKQSTWVGKLKLIFARAKSWKEFYGEYDIVLTNLDYSDFKYKDQDIASFACKQIENHRKMSINQTI